MTGDHLPPPPRALQELGDSVEATVEVAEAPRRVWGKFARDGINRALLCLRARKENPSLNHYPPPPPVARWYTRLWNLTKQHWKRLGLFGLVALGADIIGYQTLVPRLGIARSFKDTSGDPFSARYDITNVGYVPITNIEIGCLMDFTQHVTPDDVPGYTFVDFYFKPQQPLDKLRSQQTYTTKCRKSITVNQKLSKSRINFVSMYDWWLKRSQEVWTLQYVSKAGSEQEFVEMPNWRALGRLTPSGIFST